MTGIFDDIVAVFTEDCACRDDSRTTRLSKKDDFNRDLLEIPIDEDSFNAFMSNPKIKAYFDYRRKIYKRRLKPIYSEIAKLKRMEHDILHLVCDRLADFYSLVYNVTFQTITNHHFRQIYCSRKTVDNKFVECYESALNRKVDELLDIEKSIYNRLLLNK